MERGDNTDQSVKEKCFILIPCLNVQQGTGFDIEGVVEDDYPMEDGASRSLSFRIKRRKMDSGWQFNWFFQP